MKKKPSILIIGNFLSGTGGSRGVCEDLAERMRKAGWSVVTSSNKPGRVARLLDMLNTIWNQRNQYELASIDTFSGLSFVWAEAASFMLRKLGKPYILILHGGNLPNFAKRWPGRVKRLLRSATVVTAPSRFLLEQMRLSRPDILLIPNPIDISKYSFTLRKESRTILLWLRAFHEIYNPHLAIRTVAALVQKHPNTRLLMGGGDKGDGSLQEAQQLAGMLGLSSTIEFDGRIPNTDVSAWLQRGDIFINTTNVDNTPISVLEAMACGLCIVSTNVGGIPYLLENEKDALLVPPNNPEAMAAAVNRILAESGLSARLSGNARKKAERFDWSVILPEWEQLIEKVLELK